MTDCLYCHQPCEDGQTLACFNIHSTCHTEWYKRIDADSCTHCGNEFPVDNLGDCRDCDGKWEYTGYPGP